MKNVLTIIKKEFSRFFKDRRMIITIFLPGVLIYVMYSLMGAAIGEMVQIDSDLTPTAYVYDMPSALSPALGSLLEVSEENPTLEEAKERVAEGNADLVIVFPQNFDAVLGENAILSVPPNVEIYYNSSSDNSTAGLMLVEALLESVNSSVFTVNYSGGYDLASERDLAGNILSMMIPLLMFALLSSACVALAPESIAGEKERGTLATILITPLKRWQLALGKIISLACFAMLSGISSFIGVLLSLPKLMSGFIGAETAAYYTAGNYLMILGIIISVVLVIISLFSVLSALAKSVKEAGTMITPVMMVVILLGVSSMFVSSSPALGLFAIPLLGSALSLSAIMSFTASGLAVTLAIASNLIVAAVFIVLLAFMFRSEKIMFNR